MKHKCPICKTETDSTLHRDFPFCSDRCRERDLGNWATEKYVVSDAVFDEDELEESGQTTIILNLNDDPDEERGDPNDGTH